MAEQSGPSIAAIQARQTALASRHDTATDADRVLSEVLTSAHAAMRDSVARLDAIVAEIDHAVRNQAALAIDTPLGASEFQGFLVAKQREIAAVVAQAHELDRAKRAVLESLRTRYAPSAAR
jgi:predicted component of type VI protein secretion system